MLPTGTVTILFTDIEGSTPLWERASQAMQAAIALHHAILRQAISANQGMIFGVDGDSFKVAFPLAWQGIKTAIELQRTLQNAAWPAETGALRVRMGLHTGAVTIQDAPGAGLPGGDYAPCHTLNRAARVMSAGHGGQILLSQECADLVQRDLPADVTLKDLGEHRLKGMQRLEHLYQVLAPGLQQVFPPLATGIIHPNNLPAQMTIFIGREKEIEAVADLLCKHRLVTLTGSGGVGKTRLSLEVATRLLADYPAGTWYVELAALSEPTRVAQTVAYSLGLRDEPGIPILDTLTFYLSSRQVFIILDNCEHLIQACASLASHLLTHCPKIHLLASSREALGVDGETTFRVPSLAVPDPHQPVSSAALAKCEAVRLFVARAQLIEPDFRLTAANAAATAQVCQRLDGIPLAIELAAARLSVLPVDQIAARLDDAFRLLTGGSRSALPRQQTLRALIDWSYRLLTKTESQLFRRLSVFSGGWTLEAAEAICSGQGLKPAEILDLLSSLVAKSLVIGETQPGLARRFRLLETVRQYAREKLFDEQESQALRTRHRDYYLQLAEVAGVKYCNAERLEWTPRLRLELDNFRLALEWSYHTEPEAENGLQLLTPIREWWNTQGYEREVRDWLQAGLERCASRPISPLLRARALVGLGNSAWLMGDPASAHRWLEQAIAACRAIGPAADNDLCEALYSHGMAYIFENPALTWGFLEESVNVGRQAGVEGRYFLGRALFFRAWLAIFGLGDAQRAQQDAQESYDLFSQAGVRWDCGLPCIILGWVAHENNQTELAKQRFQESLELLDQTRDQMGMFNANLIITCFYSNLGDYPASLQHLRQAFRFWNLVGYRGPSSLAFLAAFGSLEIRLSQAERPALSAVRRADHLRRGAFILGAAEKLRGNINLFSRYFTYAAYSHCLVLLHSQLQDGKVARAYNAGQALSFDQAWTYLVENYS